MELIEMTGKMLFDLPLGFREKSEIHAIAESSGAPAERERSRVPERIEQARAAPELADALRAPGEVVALLLGRALQRFARAAFARGEGLALVQRLRANFPDVVHPHQ